MNMCQAIIGADMTFRQILDEEIISIFRQTRGISYYKKINPKIKKIKKLNHSSE
jgi:hypothetical protein